MKTSAFKKKVLESLQEQIRYIAQEISMYEDVAALEIDNMCPEQHNYTSMRIHLHRAELLLKMKGLDAYDGVLHSLLLAREGLGWLNAEIDESYLDGSEEEKKC